MLIPNESSIGVSLWSCSSTASGLKPFLSLDDQAQAVLAVGEVT